MTGSLAGQEEQIAEARRTIKSDGYPMSIGELTNLYRENELIIRPEFQRFFRWSDVQKSNLVESLLLGIPLPSIFVAQTEEGKWELVDGLQRISTILQLQGELKDETGNPWRPLLLQPTKYLSALGGRRWIDDDASKSLSDAQRLDIKRAKIDIKIIQRESSPQTKYDLFQRLNSYGSRLTAQELRSALLVAVSPEFFSWIEGLANNQDFKESVLLSDRLLDERYDLELVLRFLILHDWPESDLNLSKLRDFSQVLDDVSVKLAIDYPQGNPGLKLCFDSTFEFIRNNGGEDIFRRWDRRDARFKGSFLNTAFEVFALGVGFHAANGSGIRSDLLNIAKNFWASDEMQQGYATGKSTEARMVRFIPLGRKIVAQ
jgi:Protein of unknown function DUF262